MAIGIPQGTTKQAMPAADDGARGSTPARPHPAGGLLPGPGLVAASAPPFRLPGEHFVASLFFLAAGALGLIAVAPDLARGFYSLPRVVAVAHLFTLGWITMTIQGALYQFLPVALGTPIRSERLGHLSFALYAPGVVMFVAGLLLSRDLLFLPGAALFGAGLLIFVGNLAATLRRCRERNLVWWALVGAATSLLVTVVLGLSLAGNLRWGYLGGDRLLALGVHMHVAIGGWVLLVMVGVAHRLLPMFLLSHGASTAPGRLALALLAVGTAVLVALHHSLTQFLTWIIVALLEGGLIAFLLQATLFFRHGRKPSLDPGLRLVRRSLAFLGAAAVLAPFVVMAGPGSPRLATGYATALVVGGISLFVVGHLYKILPFLVWFHRFGPLVGKQPVPRVAELYSARLASVGTNLLAVGALGLVASILSGAIGVTTLAAVAFAAGAAVTVIQMLILSRARPE